MKTRLPIGWLPPIALLVILACALAGPEGLRWPSWQTPLDRALWTLRAHRILTAFVVGAALASAGTVFQAVLRNPLADPYVLGVSGGGALGAATAIVFGWQAWHAMALPLAAFVAALATLALVYALASQRGVTATQELILSGVIVSSMASSLLLLLLSFASVEGLHGITWWTLGNLQGASAPLLAACSACAAVGYVVNWGLARDLNALTLGSGMAHHLGVRTRRVVPLALAGATLAAAAAVALAGLIGFVGLLAPHAVRQFTGGDHRRLLPTATLAGGVLLVFCDTIARIAISPRELPAGVITALIGGPFFLVLLRRRHGAWFDC